MGVFLLKFDYVITGDSSQEVEHAQYILLKTLLMNKNNQSKKISTQARERGQFATQNREIFQELKEIKNEVKEVKKLLIINSLRRLVDNYEQIAKTKQKKLEKE